MQTQTQTRAQKPGSNYIPVPIKFLISQLLAAIWLSISIVLSLPWVLDLGSHTTHIAAILIVAAISYIPGYFNAFMVISLLLDKQPKFLVDNPAIPITIVIACRNEEKAIGDTLKYIARQDYSGKLIIIMVDNGSTDKTVNVAKKAGRELGIELKVLFEPKAGKSHALNTALKEVATPFFITLDADTLLHKSAIKHIVSRMLSAPADVSAVAGAVLVRNSRQNIWAKVQEWDYFLGIASIKRLQGMYQSTLVAQGAFSLYRTDKIREIGGWTDSIGEDIVLTWKMLYKRSRVFFEPMAVAFTEVPATFKHFQRQRSRWARGMIEALKIVKPWEQPLLYTKFFTGYNILMPYLDVVYTFVWMPGLIAAFFGYYWIVGMYTIFVLPLTALQNYTLYTYQKYVFRALNLRIRKNGIGFWAYILFYQMIMAPVSVYGYIQEIFKLDRVWK
ncbi:MAG: glycosyltransferase family 2 protein [Peptococcaceae bacterium]|nr:glycosyltransferase family 2 protein [Peptococcaceae bacterium]